MTERDPYTEIIENYTENELTDAYLRMEKEVSGQGCGCLNCLRKAVDDVNYWVEWLAGEELDSESMYRINSKGQVVKGPEREKWVMTSSGWVRSDDG